MQVNKESADVIIDAWADRKGVPPREIVAEIIFDSLAQPIVNARGTADSRQVFMRAEQLDIHLKISTNPSQHQIIGQVFARNETQFLSNVRLHLLLNGERVKTTSSDNFGQFQFDDVPHGEFRLHLDLPYLSVVGGISINERDPVGPAD